MERESVRLEIFFPPVERWKDFSRWLFLHLGAYGYRDITKKDCQIKEVIVVAPYSFEK